MRRRTLELHRQVGETADAVRGRPGANAVIFVNRGPPVFPARVVRDAVIQPVDMVVSMILRRCGAKGRFPDHARIARIANVSSRSTVWRALAILRIERWLSRCAPGLSNAHAAVYALHDKPLPVSGAVVLDQGYIAFLHVGRNHARTRARRLVRRAVAGTEGGPMREVAAGGGQSGATAD